jgi:hypothetical protein
MNTDVYVITEIRTNRRRGIFDSKIALKRGEERKFLRESNAKETSIEIFTFRSQLYELFNCEKEA